MKISNGLIAMAKSVKSAEELSELAKTGGVELTEEESVGLFSRLNACGELSDDELDSVSGGGCSDSGAAPKYGVGQKVIRCAFRGGYPVTVTYVSDAKKDCGRIVKSNVFTYSVQPDRNGAPLETDVPEYELSN